MGLLSAAQISSLGFRSVGDDVRIDESAQIFGAEAISIGSHVRIDCFAVLTAGHEPVRIGDYVHLSVGACLFGTAGITVSDFASISVRATIFTTNDDYVGGHLTGATVPNELRSVDSAPVVIGPSAVVGAHAVVLPGVNLGPGAAVGALSLVKDDVPDGQIVAGIPARPIGARDLQRLADSERRLRRQSAGQVDLA